MLNMLLGVLMATATLADAAPPQQAPSRPTVRSLYGHWRIVGVTVPRDGVQALATDDLHYVGQRLTFAPTRLSWDEPNPSYGGTPCVAPVIRPARPSSESDGQLGNRRGKILRSFSVGCAGGAWGPARPPASEVMILNDGTIALWWFDGALLTLRRVLTGENKRCEPL